MSGICRLCVSTIIEPVKRFEDEVSPEVKIKFLIPEINISITPTFALCTDCSSSLNSAYSFKCKCIEIDEEIKKYAINNETVDLQYVRSQIFLESERVKTYVDIKIDPSDDNEDETEIFAEYIKIEDTTVEGISANCVEYMEDCYREDDDNSMSVKCEQSSESLSQKLPEEQLQTDTCNKTFNSTACLKSHKSTIRENKYFCDICNNKGFKTKDRFNTHIETHSGKKWICDICGKFYLSSHYLQNHIRKTHHPKYDCSTCDMKFGSKTHLTEHMRTHTGERPYKCEFCGKGFAQQSTLGTHINCIHNSTEKSFACSTCDKAFNVESYLRRHMDSHKIVKKSFICPHCNKAYTTRKNLYNHIRLHLSRKKHKCPVCGREFHQKRDLTIHKRIHTGEKPYECHTCQKTFTKKWNLQVHFNSHRPKKSEDFEMAP